MGYQTKRLRGKYGLSKEVREARVSKPGACMAAAEGCEGSDASGA